MGARRTRAPITYGEARRRGSTTARDDTVLRCSARCAAASNGPIATVAGAATASGATSASPARGASPTIRDATGVQTAVTRRATTSRESDSRENKRECPM